MKRNKTIFISLLIVSALIGGARYFFWKSGVSADVPVSPVSLFETVGSATSAPFADLYYLNADCDGDGRFSSLDVNIGVPQSVYRTPLGGVYIPVATSSTDTITASVLRDDGCYNFDEPSEMTTFAAELVK